MTETPLATPAVTNGQYGVTYDSDDDAGPIAVESYVSDMSDAAPSPLSPMSPEAAQAAYAKSGRVDFSATSSPAPSPSPSHVDVHPTHHVHPSADQVLREQLDSASGHAHNRSPATIAREGDSVPVVFVNDHAPWTAEAHEVEAGSKLHHAIREFDSPMPSLDERQVSEAEASAEPAGSSSAAAPASSSVSSAPASVTVNDDSLGLSPQNRRASEQSRRELAARVDRWGNIHSPDELAEDGGAQPKTAAQLAKERLKRSQQLALDQEREGKWVKMVANWDRTMLQRSAKVKRRIRKGIPDSMRGAVWPRFTGAIDLLRGTPSAASASASVGPAKTGPGVFARYGDMVSKEQDTIARDIARTFPHHVLFRDSNPAGDPAGIGEGIGGAGQGRANGDDAEGQNSHGRNALYNVLKAYSLHDEQTGYCQGMGFPAGMFLMYMTEEEAFWMLHCIARGEKYLLSGLWSPGFPLLFQCFYQFSALLKKHCPRLSTHLLSQDPPIVPELYATHWFMTLFSYNLPFDVVLRIWDILLAEGPKIIFRLAIFFCKHMEKELLAEKDFAMIMDILKNLHHRPLMQDPDAVIEGALELTITRSELSKLAQAYQTEKFNADQAKQKAAQERQKQRQAAANGEAR